MFPNLSKTKTFFAALRLRGAGKLWEVSMSSMESNSDVDSDESYEDVSYNKTKTLTRLAASFSKLNFLIKLE